MSIQIPLPKGAGNVLVDTSKISTEVRERAMVHGFTQKIADIGAGVYLKSEMKREPKETDRVFEDAVSLAKFLRERAAAMVEAWEAGAWTITRSAPPVDPVLAEFWAIIFQKLQASRKEMPKLREAGTQAAIELIVKAAVGEKKVSKAKLAEVTQKLHADLMAKAEANVKRRAEAADIDLSDLL